MANITFILKSEKPDKNGERPIIVQTTHNYKKVRFTTGEKVKPSLWNKKKQRINANKEIENEQKYNRINKLLDEIESKFKNIINDAKLKDIEISDSFIKANLFKAEVKKKEVSFFDIFDEYVKTNTPNRAKGTIKGYNSVINFLKDFEGYSKIKICFNGIDLILFDKLKEYAFTERKIADNYFSRILRVVKSFMNWAKERSYHNNDTFKKFIAPEKNKDVIYLTIDELMKLNNYKFETECYNNVRDIYCFGCFTGLRISDIKQLTREKIKNNYIHITLQKTKSIETIPLNSYAKAIIDKHANEEELLPFMSEQKLNDYIKKCCKLAGIEDRITIVKFSGGNRTEITLPKCEFITTHTARKTFVTNSLILGMNVKTIKSITGHKSDGTFEKYLKIAEDYKKLEMDNTWGKISVEKEEKK